MIKRKIPFFYLERITRFGFAFVITTLLARIIPHDMFGEYQLTTITASLLVCLIGFPTVSEFMRSKSNDTINLNSYEVLFTRYTIGIFLLPIAGLIQLFIHNTHVAMTLIAAFNICLMTDLLIHSHITNYKKNTIIAVFTGFFAVKVISILTTHEYYVKIAVDAIESIALITLILRPPIIIDFLNLKKKFIQTFRRDVKIIGINFLAGASQRIDFIIIYKILGAAYVGTYALYITAAGMFQLIASIFLEKKTIELMRCNRDDFTLGFEKIERQVNILTIVASLLYIPTSLGMMVFLWNRSDADLITCSIFSLILASNIFGSLYSIRINYYGKFKLNTLRLIISIMINFSILYVSILFNLQNLNFIVLFIALSALTTNYFFHKITKDY
jgi:hypothetical protein